MAVAPRALFYTFCLWLSLATVLGHALVPVGSPLAKRAGSAFSVSTYDVSLRPSRPDAPTKFKRMQDRAGEGSGPFGDGPEPVIAAAAIAALSPPALAGLIVVPLDRPAPAFSPSRSFDARAPPRA